MRELFLARHGESEGNAGGIVQGRGAYRLTEKGRADADAVGALMERLGWRPDRIVTSPLPRCAETAERIAPRLGMGTETETDDAFTEIDCGTAAGRRFSELEAEHPEFFLRPASEWCGFSEFGGESDDELIVRVGAGLDALPSDESILIVTHGAVFKGVLAHLLGLRTPYFLDLRNDTCMRLDRRRIGTTDVMALTHFLHATEHR